MQWTSHKAQAAQAASVAKAEGLKRLPIQMTQQLSVTLCEKCSGGTDKTADIVTTNSDEIQIKFGQSSIPTAQKHHIRNVPGQIPIWAPAPAIAF